MNFTYTKPKNKNDSTLIIYCFHTEYANVHSNTKITKATTLNISVNSRL